MTVYRDRRSRRGRDSWTLVGSCRTRRGAKGHSTGRARRHKSSTAPPTQAELAARGTLHVTEEVKVIFSEKLNYEVR